MHSTNTTTIKTTKIFDKYRMRLMLLLIMISCLGCPAIVEACSSRAVPKPRPSISSSMSGTVLPPTQAPSTTTTTTARPNITFSTYKCPDDFDAWYCLNDARCFAVKIGDLPVYSCECSIGFMGQRCEYKEIDASYAPDRPRRMLETASIASGAMCALVCMLLLCLAYLRCEQRKKKAYELDSDLQEENDQGSDNEQCDCCRAKCCAGGNQPLIIESKLPYHMRLEPTLMSFAKKRSTKI